MAGANDGWACAASVGVERRRIKWKGPRDRRGVEGCMIDPQSETPRGHSGRVCVEGKMMGGPLLLPRGCRWLVRLE